MPKKRGAGERQKKGEKDQWQTPSLKESPKFEPAPERMKSSTILTKEIRAVHQLKWRQEARSQDWTKAYLKRAGKAQGRSERARDKRLPGRKVFLACLAGRKWGRSQLQQEMASESSDRKNGTTSIISRTKENDLERKRSPYVAR